jgi:hypothetical protein
MRTVFQHHDVPLMILLIVAVGILVTLFAIACVAAGILRTLRRIEPCRSCRRRFFHAMKHYENTIRAHNDRIRAENESSIRKIAAERARPRGDGIPAPLLAKASANRHPAVTPGVLPPINPEVTRLVDLTNRAFRNVRRGTTAEESPGSIVDDVLERGWPEPKW